MTSGLKLNYHRLSGERYFQRKKYPFPKMLGGISDMLNSRLYPSLIYMLARLPQHSTDSTPAICLTSSHGWENEGFTDNYRKTFLIYLISQQRPMAELLQPNLKDIKDIYQKNLFR
jgi:hypothetical protein